MNAHLVLNLLSLLFIQFQGHLPREWSCPKWAGSAHINEQSSQSTTDLPTGQPDLNSPLSRLPSQVTLCVNGVLWISISLEVQTFEYLAQLLMLLRGGLGSVALLEVCHWRRVVLWFQNPDSISSQLSLLPTCHLKRERFACCSRHHVCLLSHFPL